MFFQNFSSSSVHADAERRLAAAIIDTWVKRTERIDVVAHSAGCGVALGAIARLPADVTVRRLILLAPSVSPGYDLSPAMRHCQRLDSFHSDRDRLFLQWRTSTFGGYDRVHAPAAGHEGFDLSSLDPATRARIHQHGYDPAWDALGYDGGHFSITSERFIQDVVAPLLAAASSSSTRDTSGDPMAAEAVIPRAASTRRAPGR